ncbi:MAG: hypothetical protein QOJ58_4418, partial [Alphaproteobacteria bacterium]|nr:hypothetical protein [Alphaproteobacteria bacterium]
GTRNRRALRTDEMEGLDDEENIFNHAVSR